jgi:hypothetical protein
LLANLFFARVDASRLLVAALALLVSEATAPPADGRGQEAVPPSVKRAIIGRLPQLGSFYFPRSLPPGYRYSHWERAELERSAGKPYLSVFSLYFTPPGRAWIEELRDNGHWARWRQLRLLASCSSVYGDRTARTIRGRRTFYLKGRDEQTAAACERGYVAELTVNHHPLAPLALMRLAAEAELIRA